MTATELRGLLVIGLGMGLFIAPIFDTIIAAVTDAETGSASGVLNAVQQLGGAVGVAVLGTIFFSAAARGDFAGALHRTMWWQVTLMGVMLLASPLLPRRARETAPAEAGAARPPSQPPVERAVA